MIYNKNVKEVVVINSNTCVANENWMVVVMLEMVIIIIVIFLFGYCYYKSNINRSNSLIEEILNERDKEENNDVKNKI